MRALLTRRHLANWKLNGKNKISEKIASKLRIGSMLNDKTEITLLPTFTVKTKSGHYHCERTELSFKARLERIMCDIKVTFHQKIFGNQLYAERLASLFPLRRLAARRKAEVPLCPQWPIRSHDNAKYFPLNSGLSVGVLKLSLFPNCPLIDFLMKKKVRCVIHMLINFPIRSRFFG